MGEYRTINPKTRIMEDLNDINPEITSEWARKQATEILSDKIVKQLQLCFGEITKAVKDNLFSTTVYMSPHIRTVEILQSRGFAIKVHNATNQRDEDYIEIKW